jgi:positive regulator of sigma E activity
MAVRERGVVIEVNAGRALVEVTPGPGCGRHCSCSVVDGRPHLRRVELEAPDGVRAGSPVTLEVNSGQLIALSAVVFLGPLVFFVLGAVLGRRLFGALGLHVNADLAMLLGGVVAFLVGLGAALLVSRVSARRGWLKPHIVEVGDSAF